MDLTLNFAVKISEYGNGTGQISVTIHNQKSDTLNNIFTV